MSSHNPARCYGFLPQGMITEILFLVDYSGNFTIVVNTGELYVEGSLSCCDVIYQLKVVAKDQGIPPRKSAEVEIQIIPFSGSNPPSPHTGKRGERRKGGKKRRERKRKG